MEPDPNQRGADVHSSQHTLRLKWLGIDTYQEAVIYMRGDCHVCRAEGFEAQSRIQVMYNGHVIIATLNVVTGDLLAPGEAGLSEAAWRWLGAHDGDVMALSHQDTLQSLSLVRAKVYSKKLNEEELQAIVRDIAAGHYAGIHLSAFITTCAGDQLNLAETVGLFKGLETRRVHLESLKERHGSTTQCPKCGS